MTPERWQRIEELYHLALERPAEERANWLVEACAGDDALRREVVVLLQANEKAQEFLTGHALNWESQT